MSMKLTQLHTYLTADDADLILSFLDELRDTLWAAYGPEIIEQRQQAHHGVDNWDNRQLRLDSQWEGPF